MRRVPQRPPRAGEQSRGNGLLRIVDRRPVDLDRVEVEQSVLVCTEASNVEAVGTAFGSVDTLTRLPVGQPVPVADLVPVNDPLRDERGGCGRRVPRAQVCSGGDSLLRNVSRASPCGRGRCSEVTEPVRRGVGWCPPQFPAVSHRLVWLRFACAIRVRAATKAAHRARSSKQCVGFWRLASQGLRVEYARQ